MSNKTRKHIWPVSLIAALGIVAVLALMAATVWMPGPAQAQSGPTNPFGATPVPGTTPTGPTNPFATPVPGTTPVPTTPADTITITSDSSTSSGSPEIKVVINNLSMYLPVGSQIVLYLEDDYQEPSSIPSNTVYFVATGGNAAQQVKTGSSARVYATDQIKIDNDDYFDATKNDIRIAVPIPDMCTSSTDACQGPNGPFMGQMLTMVVQNNSGIKNPSEAGSHSADLRIVGSADSLPHIGPAGGDPNHKGITELETLAKISLSDSNNKRGYAQTVTGTGFNNGSTATAYVLNRAPTTEEWWNELNCAEMNAVVDPNKAVTDATMGTSPCTMYVGLDTTAGGHKSIVDAADTTTGYAEMGVCRVVIDRGTAAGSALVGSDDTVAVVFDITVPVFKPGNVNYICMEDGEGRRSDEDVEKFELEDSIRLVPATVSAGDTVTVFAQDFPGTPGLTEVKLAGKVVWKSDPAADDPNKVNVSAAGIARDGSATITFDMPGSINNVPLQGVIRIDAKWGSVNANANITVAPATLTLSKASALPNQTITIQGVGFGDATENDIDLTKITIDDVPMAVDDDSRDGSEVTVSSAGQFVATVFLWNASGTSNPALIAGNHTIKVENKAGFVGTAVLEVPEAAINITPDVAGPRTFVQLSGENWPVDNPDSNTSLDTVSITVTEGSRERKYSAIPDSSGRWNVEHRVGSAVAIPSTNQVKVEYGSDIAKVTSFRVPEAVITIEPAEAKPGDTITLMAEGMPVYASVDEIKIGGRVISSGLDFSTDRVGAVAADGIRVPGLDPGTYSVEMKINDIVAIGSIDVLPEGPAGIASALPGAVTNLGDKLVRVFHFNGVDKTWSFFDSRADFADLNTLTEMIEGEPYWILVSEGVDDVVLNNKTRAFTCVGGDCWNQLVW